MNVLINPISPIHSISPISPIHSIPFQFMILPTLEDDLVVDAPFALESGGVLRSLTLRYARYGQPNDGNVILVCHALSGSARVGDWWPQLFGEAGVFRLDRDCVIGVNIPGSCYGSTGPQHINPETGRPFGADFPLVTVRDWVRAQALLLDQLGIRRLRAVIGASVGGMQAIQWAIEFPDRVARAIAIGAAPLGAMGLALNHLQRQAIFNDPNWRDGLAPPHAGLALARAIAMCSYKSAHLFTERYARRPDRSGVDPTRSMHARHDVGGYLDYQGELFTRRFDAHSYLLITKAMDNFDPARGYPTEADALARIQARMLLVGISSDWLFPASDVRALAERMKLAGVAANYAELESSHGHDGFLAEPEKLTPLISLE
jgi:homoserine O-acetyltransferase/O-succinyltransferase